MDEDAVVLTSYFRNRHRTGAGLLSDALISLYEHRPVAASILLRGSEGYGLGQPTHAGHSFPLPEDSPLTVVAVGTGPLVGTVTDEVARLTRPRLITAEQVRLLSGQVGPLSLGESSSEATRLTIFCGHGDRVFQVPAFEAACEVLYRRKVAGATVLSGVDGTVGGRRQHTQFLHVANAPLMVVVVGSGDQIAMALPELGGLFRHPLMTLAKVGLCKRDGQLVSRPETLAAVRGLEEPAGTALRLRLTIYNSEAVRHDGQPVHSAIVRELRSAGISGATSHRGIWGFHGDHQPHGDHFPRHDRHAPIVTTVIDTPERVAAAFDVIDTLTPGRGLVTAEPVLIPQLADVSTDQGSRC